MNADESGVDLAARTAQRDADSIPPPSSRPFTLALAGSTKGVRQSRKWSRASNSRSCS